MSRCRCFSSSLGNHMRTLQVANERIIDFDFLYAVAATFIAFMDNDLFNQFMKHSGGQFFKGSIFPGKFHKTVDIDRFGILLCDLALYVQCLRLQGMLFIFVIPRKDYVALV